MKTIISILKNPMQVASISLVALLAITLLSLTFKVKVFVYLMPVVLICMVIYTMLYCVISIVASFNEEEKNQNE
jgi:glucan phosphoethanolaminetransferase (alkaline phosphatase superfamily)